MFLGRAQGTQPQLARRVQVSAAHQHFGNLLDALVSQGWQWEEMGIEGFQKSRDQVRAIRWRLAGCHNGQQRGLTPAISVAKANNSSLSSDSFRHSCEVSAFCSQLLLLFSSDSRPIENQGPVLGTSRTTGSQIQRPTENEGKVWYHCNIVSKSPLRPGEGSDSSLTCCWIWDLN